MSEHNDILQFSFNGGGVNPSSFKSKELAEVLICLEDSIKAYVSENNTDKDSLDDIYLSLTEIINESCTLGYDYKFKRIIYTAFFSIATAVSTGVYDNIPQKTINSLLAIQKIVRNKGCKADFRINNNTIASFDANTLIGIPESQKISGDTTIYGKVQRVGGAEPRVKIVLDDNSVLYCDVEEDTAIELAKRLYKEVGLNGHAKWDINSLKVIEFKVDSIIENYVESSIIESFKELKIIGSKYWDEIEDIEEYLYND